MDEPALRMTQALRARSTRDASGLRFLVSGAAVVVAVLLSAPASPAAPQTAAPQTGRVLLLHSFGQNFSPWNRISARFREELVKQSPRPIDLFEVSLQNVQVDETRYQQTFLDYLRALYAEREPDLVVAMGAPAARFFEQHRGQIFPSTPLLIAGADVRTYRAGALNANDTAVAVSFDLPALIDNILQVLPDTTSIAVVIGDSPLERFWVEELRRDFARFGNRVRFDYLNKLSFDEIVQRVASLPPHSAIFYGSVRVDAHGVPQEEDRVFARLTEVAKSPIFGYEDHTVGHGAVGGPQFLLQELGRRVATVAVRMLNGEKGGDIRTPVTRLSAPIYDWRELQRWGISDSRLPAGSEIRFRQPSLWEQYRWQISLVAGVILLQTVLIAGLLYEHRRRRTAEDSARSSLSELAHLNRLATAGELSASIAHEISQPLTGIVAHANAGLLWLGGANPNIDEARTTFEDIVEVGHHAADVVQNIRSFVKKSDPQNTLLDLNDLVRSVLSLAGTDLRKHDIAVVTALSEPLPPVIGDRVQLKQVVMNLIMNAAEAMAATTDRPRTLHVASRHDPSVGVLVEVKDSGPGIPLDDVEGVFKAFYTTKAQGMGMGLSISRSIVAAHGGRLWASAGSPHGAVFHLALPVAGSQQKPAQADPPVTNAGKTLADRIGEPVMSFGTHARPSGTGSGGPV
jgi:signal transduction histidine kinase